MEAQGRKVLIEWAARGRFIYYNISSKTLDLNYYVEVLN